MRRSLVSLSPLLLCAVACSPQSSEDAAPGNGTSAAEVAADAPALDNVSAETPFAEPTADDAVLDTPSDEGADSAAITDGDPYPETAVLDAFRAACGDLGSLAAARKAATGSGWVELAQPDGAVGQIVKLGRESGAAIVKEHGGKLGPTLAYRRMVAGERLFLVLSELTVKGRTALGCRLYDPGETRKITATAAAKFIGRPPSAITDQKELQRARWEPGLNGARSKFEIYYVPAESPAIKLTHMSGIGLIADTVIE